MTAFGVCVGSWDKFHANVAPTLPRGAEVIALAGQSSIAIAYNKILRAVREADVDALVLLHDDLEITDPDAETKIREAAERYTVAGVAGSRGETPTLAWWDLGCDGRQETDSGPVGSGRFGPVDTVDGSILILSKWAATNLRFDDRYPAFHGYDVDLCRQVADVGVVDLATHHHTTLGWKSDMVRESWEQANLIYRSKWGL